MVTIIFESHATSLDNKADLASGWYDVDLSELGKKQAKELGKPYVNDHFDAIFCSDLKRSYKTGKIAFAQKSSPIVKDTRLRECNYGDFTRHPNKEVNPLRVRHITKPFPNGESYQEAAKRMKNFLQDLLKHYDGKKVMIIGHRATQCGLEHWIKHISLKKVVSVPWKWQPGWTYHLSNI